jgi:Zn-finger nucleic acid-binding protein
MQCPTDGTVLTMSERSGIEIDYCPTCRGVWLDRGEIDKIIERSLAQAAPPATAPAPASPPQQQYSQPQYQERGYDQRGYDQRSQGHRPKKKEHWLSELLG